jgi:hypothetical protein
MITVSASGKVGGKKRLAIGGCYSYINVNLAADETGVYSEKEDT